MDWKAEVIHELKQYHRLVSSVENLKSELQDISYQIQDVRGQVLSFEPKAGKRDPGDKLNNMVYRKRVLTTNLRMTQNRLQRIDSAFATLTEAESLILNRMVVVGGKRVLDELLNELSYSKSQIYRTRDEALSKIATALWGLKII